jgi:hypothetical protein
MLKIKELMMVLKQRVLFFVLQILKIVLLTQNTFKTQIISLLNRFLSVFQFSVLVSGFSVLVPVPGKLNSLYRASDSLKN